VYIYIVILSQYIIRLPRKQNVSQPETGKCIGQNSPLISSTTI